MLKFDAQSIENVLEIGRVLNKTRTVAESWAKQYDCIFDGRVDHNKRPERDNLNN